MTLDPNTGFSHKTRSSRRAFVAVLVCSLMAGSCLGPELKLPIRHNEHEAKHTRVPRRLAGDVSRARATRITSSEELLHGIAASGKVGDLKLENEQVAFVIDAATSRYGFAESGGNLIDAAPVQGKDALKQMFGYLNDTFPRQPVYDRVEIIEDEKVAAQTGVAIVRATGHDSENASLTITTDYRLEPSTAALEIVTRIQNDGTAPIKDYEVGDAIEFGRTVRFAPSVGFDPSGAQTIPEGYLEAVGEQVSYAYVTESGPLKGYHEGAFSDLNLGTETLSPGQSATVRRFFVVTAHADSQLQHEVALIRRERWARVEGRVVEEVTGAQIDGAEIFFDDVKERPMALTTSADGHYSALVPPGEYRLRTTALGRRGPTRLGVVASVAQPSQIDVLVSRPGSLTFRVRAGDQDLPAKLTFLGRGDTATPRLGAFYANPGENVYLSQTGSGTIALEPGQYQVIASHGPMYSLDVQEVSVVPGAEEKVTFQLERAIEGGNYVCGDLHEHTDASVDSAVSLADRLTANLAEGLDFFVATDHNITTDLSAAAQLNALGKDRIVAISGVEGTREGVGHFNAYPVSHSPPIPPRGTSAHEIVRQLRAAAGATGVVQVNHPRSGQGGYFNTVGYDPAEAALPAEWEGGFDAIELVASKDLSTVDQVLRDWLALLLRGNHYTGVAGSDSHFVVSDEVGYPRTCVAVPNPQRFKADDVVRALKVSRDAFITNGPFVQVTASGKSFGQLVPTVHGKARIEISIQAAPWIDVRRVELLVNGQRRGKPIEVPASKSRERFQSAIDLKISEDSFVVVVVRGDVSLEPIVARPSGRAAPLPIAITNPIYLDRDGDGKWTPPAVAKKP